MASVGGMIVNRRPRETAKPIANDVDELELELEDFEGFQAAAGPTSDYLRRRVQRVRGRRAAS